MIPHYFPYIYIYVHKLLIAGAFVDLLLLCVHLSDKVYFLIVSIEFIYFKRVKKDLPLQMTNVHGRVLCKAN